MMELANVLSLVQEGAQGLLTTLTDYLAKLGLETGELSAGSAALILAVVWYFARIIRMVVGILFTVCILLLVLQLAGYVDFSGLWESLQGWMGQGSK